MQNFYCSAATLLDLFKKGKSSPNLSFYKRRLHIGEIELEPTIPYPKGVKETIRKIACIEKADMEILSNVDKILKKARNISKFDALAISICRKRGYCLATADRILRKVSSAYGVNSIDSKDLILMLKGA